MRSLSYMCRRFDNVSRGKDYETVRPVYHISFLDFTLFENHPEFFAKFQLRNSKDNFLYTDKFNLYVIESNHIEMATAEDKSNDIDTWARLFKATTWEEIKMITKENPSLNSTAESIFYQMLTLPFLNNAVPEKMLSPTKIIKMRKFQTWAKKLLRWMKKGFFFPIRSMISQRSMTMSQRRISALKSFLKKME